MTQDIWQPQVTRRSHPSGDAGIRVSLDEVAKRIREGFDHPKVRRWAGKKLLAAGDPKGGMNRARALLDAFRKQRVWMPDPQNVEYMVAPHLMLGDGDTPPEMPGGDCDDVCIAYFSACEAVGIRTAIVGAAYDDAGNISHVLGMVTDDDGSWYYVDPSTEWPFGECKKATREDMVDVRTGKHICMAESCSVTLDGSKPPELGAGRFVGVDGLPGMLGAMVGDDMTTTPTAANFDQLTALSKQLDTAWNTLVDVYHDARDVSTILGMPQPGDPANRMWTPDNDASVREIQNVVVVLRQALDQAAAGARQTGYFKYDKGPLEGTVDVGMALLPSDQFYVALDPNMYPHVYNVSDNSPVAPSGQIAGWPIIVGVVIVGSLIHVYLVDTVLSHMTKQLAIAATSQEEQRKYELLKGGHATPEQLVALDDAKRKVADAQAKANPTPPPISQQIGDTAKAAATSISEIVTVGVGAAVVLGLGYVAFETWKAKKR